MRDRRYECGKGMNAGNAGQGSILVKMRDMSLKMRDMSRIMRGRLATLQCL